MLEISVIPEPPQPPASASYVIRGPAWRSGTAQNGVISTFHVIATTLLLIFNVFHV